MTRARYVESPVGDLLVVGDGRVVRGLYFPDHRPAPRLAADIRYADDGFDEVVVQLEQWFARRRSTFDLDIELEGTDFQRSVWAALRAIPYGATTTYGELAEAVGRPGAARAVGHAVARNPLSIIVPCHRVVGRDGTLTGYAGGVDRKRALLAVERAA